MKSIYRLALPVLLALLTLWLVTVHLATAAEDTPDKQAVVQSSSATPLCFVSNYQVACVNRFGLQAIGSITEQVRSIVQAMVIGPTTSEKANGLRSALPGGTTLSDVSVIDDHVRIDLILPDSFLKSLNADQVESINEQFSVTFTPFNFKRIDVNTRDANGTYKPLSRFLVPIEIPHKESAFNSLLQPTSSPLTGEGQSGGLRNKTVFVSAGHGWYWNTTFNTYRTQRPVYPSSPYPGGEGIVEDFNNAEAVNQYLLQYLWNAGADAWTMRERDMNTAMLIIDDASVNFSTQGTWSTGAGGYANGYYSTTTVNAGVTATATWSFTPLTTATYAVYVWFPSVATTRTVDARYFIEHAGGTTPITITQARDGNNWRFVGMYPFYGGQVARIRLTNQSGTPGVSVLADAVRVGGGMADTPAPNSSVISNKPRWEEQAWTYAKWIGLPNVATFNDVIVRPIYSEWEKEAGEDAVYVAWHTNGYNGYNTVARGTESYIHSFEPTPNSDILQNYVHAALINGIHLGWDPTWPDRGKKTQDLGELRLLDSMPGVLIENGYHDNPQDVDAMKDPRFNQISARAIYHGLVNYWHAMDPNVPLVYAPEPPTHLTVRNNGVGQITLSWQPGPTDNNSLLGSAAASYRVYTSVDGFGWRDGIDAASTVYTLTGLTPNQLIYVRVTGVNQGGESFPTPVLAARSGLSGLAPLLIVYGFDRIDRNGATLQNDPPEGYSRRVFVDRINRFDTIIQHASAITLPFDSAHHAAVSDGSIGLSSYYLVDWVAGEEQTPFTALKANDESQLSSFLDNGGALFISGSKIGSDLHGTAFYANTLRAAYTSNNANTYTLNPQPGSLFNGLGAITFDDGAHGTYNVDYPDVFNPINGAATALVYNTGGPAALQYATGPCTRLVYSAVPFESIYPAAARRSVMTRVIDYLDNCLPVDVDTTIAAPIDGAIVNSLPSFDGAASSNAITVQVSIKRLADLTFYNGTTFITSTEIWLNANGASTWGYPLPILSDGAYALRARAIGSGLITDSTPAAITFTLDTVPPDVPAIITPTNGISMVAVAPTFEWTGHGNPNRFEIELDGVTTTINSPVLSTTLPVTDGDHLWRVRAYDAADNVSDWSGPGQFSTRSFKVYLPLIVRDYAGEQPPPVTTCTNTISNGDFETGNLSGWASVAQNPPPGVVSHPVNDGAFAARIGAPDAATPITGYSSIQQSIAVPGNAVTATLSFARYRYSGDTDDLQYVVVISSSGSDYLVYDHVNDPSWLSGQFDLLPYAGQTITLRLGVYNNGASGSAGMVIDDMQSQICIP